MSITAADLEAAFGEPLGPLARAAVERAHLRYVPLQGAERDQALLRILGALEGSAEAAGPHRLERWEAGWSENLAALGQEEASAALVPRYFGKFDVVRWRQQLVRPLTPRFEYEMLALIQCWLFERSLPGASAIYEFGCGTGHNLIRAGEFNPGAALWGLDWAESSQAVLTAFAARAGLSRLHARRFDYFAPDAAFDLAPGSVVFTVASLEQVGARHTAFVDYLLRKAPRLCLHIEPIPELLDPAHALDALSIAYMHKRKYLSGFLDHLRGLERQGVLVIHRAQRSYVGSLLLDGYSVVAWSPAEAAGTP